MTHNWDSASKSLSPKRKLPMRGELLTPMAAAGFTLAGTILFSTLLSLKAIHLIGIIFTGAGIFSFFSFIILRRQTRTFSFRIEFLTLFLLTVSVGMLLSGKERSDLLDARRFADCPSTISGTVSQVVRRSDGESRFLIKNAHIITDEGLEGKADVLFYSDGELSYDGGEKTVLHAAPSSDLTLSQIGMGGQLIIYRAEFIRDDRKSFFYSFYHLRARFLNRIQINLQRSIGKKDAGLAAGILFGNREILDVSDTIRMQSAGLSHLLAVSGLHIALFFSLIQWIFKPLGRRAALIFSLPVVGSYVFLTGGSISSKRAFIMLGMMVIAELLYRPKNILSILGTAVLFFCIAEPMCVVQSGTLLSFLSVWCIYTVAPIFRSDKDTSDQKQTFWGRMGDAALQNITVSISISIVTLPVLMLMTGSIPLLSPVCSLLVLPVMPTALTLGFLTAIGGGNILGKIAGAILRALIGWIRFVADIGNMGPKIPLGGELLRIGTIAILFFLIFSGCILGLRTLSLHRKLFSSLAAFLLSLTAFLSVLPQQEFLSISSLNGTLILQKGSQALLIGCGKNDSSAHNLVRFLRADGISSYTLLIPEGKRTFTGGAYTLCKEFAPEKILTNVLDSSLKQALESDEKLFECLVITDTAAEYLLFDNGTLSLRPAKEGLSIEVLENGQSFLFRDKDAPYPDSDKILIFYDAAESFPNNMQAKKTESSLSVFSSKDELPGWESGFTVPDWRLEIRDDTCFLYKTKII